MNWLTNFIRPKIRSIVSGQKDVPDNLWEKCPSCGGMLFHRDLAENQQVCHHCNHHLKLPVAARLQLLFDNGTYHEHKMGKVLEDPLKFRDKKKYSDRLRDAQAKSGRVDAIVVAEGTIGGIPTIISAFDFDFMGGSMGAGVGQGIVEGAKLAVKNKAAFIVIPASGGARMQEGAISLMQMPRTTVAVQMVKEAGLPYIVLLTNPTTGGVSASFAMLGDIHVSEPGATIGFAGKRVIEETIRAQLPEGFQTAEYLQQHGMVDMVVARKDLAGTLARLLDLLMQPEGRASRQTPAEDAGRDGGVSAKTIAAPKGRFSLTRALDILPQPANADAVTPPKKAAKPPRS
ncbi:MAG: acetyl-CoA carboxylase, carboxyltransferase subunit beta [Pseudomonadota bacterium]